MKAKPNIFGIIGRKVEKFGINVAKIRIFGISWKKFLIISNYDKVENNGHILGKK
jgi:hypothetical protein